MLIDHLERAHYSVWCHSSHVSHNPSSRPSLPTPEFRGFESRLGLQARSLESNQHQICSLAFRLALLLDDMWFSVILSIPKGSPVLELVDWVEKIVLSDAHADRNIPGLRQLPPTCQCMGTDQAALPMVSIHSRGTLLRCNHTNTSAP